MKKLSLLIALCMLISIGGVYAGWIYTKDNNVANEEVHMAMNLTGVVSNASYGAFEVDTTNLSLTIDPKTGTSHTTSLVIEGEVVITFTPGNYAPENVKENGVEADVTLSLTNSNWTFDDGHGQGARPILTFNHDHHDITWNDNGDGTFSYTLNADALKDCFSLTEFTLDTLALYNSYNTQLGNGQIKIVVSDTVADS